jgi:iron complex outermembrane receptor protein
MINANQPKYFPRKSILATTIALLATPVLAQQMQLEEVVVTAQKRAQSVQDVPSSVAAFSEEMLEKSNTRNFDGLGSLASGLTITPSADGFSSVIKIRGVGNNAFAPAIRPAVGIFLDDIPLSSTVAAYTNLADIIRIDVLKGPLSTLFGKEVSAGEISLYTKRPDTQSMDAYVEGNFGNDNLQEFRLGGNVPLGDSFAVRASVYSNTKDPVTKNLATQNDGPPGTQDASGGPAADGVDIDASGFRLRALWEATDNFSATLGYEEHDIAAEGTLSVAAEFGDLFYSWEENIAGVTDPADSQLIVLDPYDRENAAVSPTNRQTDTEIWSLHMDWEINDRWSMTSITGDQSYLLNNTGADNSSFVNAEGKQVDSSFTLTTAPYRLMNVIQNQGTDSFTQELRFNYEGDSWSSIIGGFYAETDLSSIVHINFLQAIFGTLPVYAPTLSNIEDDVTEWALFTHNIWSIQDGFDLTFGLRYSDVEKEATKVQLAGAVGDFAEFGHPLVPTTPWADDLPVQKDSWDEITGTVKLTWWLNDEVSLYGGWDRGFKAGGHNVCKGSEETPNCPEPFKSETADNFEVGLKGRFLDNTLVWNISAFYQTYDDYQVEIQDDEGVGNSVVNAAAVEIKGFETDFQWLSGEHLLIDGNLAYVDALWDDYKNAGCIRPQYQREVCTTVLDNGNFAQDLSGERLNYTSPWSGNLNATWSDEFDNGLNWYVRGEVSYRDDVFFFPDLDPAATADAYTVLNASLGLGSESGNWDIILWGKNLAEEEFLTAANRARDSNGLPQFTGIAPVEGYRVTPGAERSYGLTLKYRFGDF